MACDLCGKKGVSLYHFADSFQTPEVKDVCHDCMMELDDYRAKSLSAALAKMTEDVKRHICLKRRVLQG